MESVSWTGYRPLTDADSELFHQLLRDSPAADYHPLLISKKEDTAACRFLCSVPATAEPLREYIVTVAVDFSSDMDHPPSVLIYESDFRC